MKDVLQEHQLIEFIRNTLSSGNAQTPTELLRHLLCFNASSPSDTEVCGAVLGVSKSGTRWLHTLPWCFSPSFMCELWAPVWHWVKVGGGFWTTFQQRSIIKIPRIKPSSMLNGIGFSGADDRQWTPHKRFHIDVCFTQPIKISGKCTRALISWHETWSLDPCLLTTTSRFHGNPGWLRCLA